MFVSNFGVDTFAFNGHATGVAQCDGERSIVCVRAAGGSQDPTTPMSPTPPPTSTPLTTSQATMTPTDADPGAPSTPSTPTVAPTGTDPATSSPTPPIMLPAADRVTDPSFSSDNGPGAALYASIGGGVLVLLVALAVIVFRCRKAHAAATRATADAADQRPVENPAFARAPAPAPASKLQPSASMRSSANKGVIYSTESMTEGQSGLSLNWCAGSMHRTAPAYQR